MTHREHPVDQPIRMIDVHITNGEIYRYELGYNATRFEATTKSGMHADIPYIRVWNHDMAVGEFCQHHLAGVYFRDTDFDEVPEAPDALD